MNDAPESQDSSFLSLPVSESLPKFEWVWVGCATVLGVASVIFGWAALAVVFLSLLACFGLMFFHSRSRQRSVAEARIMYRRYRDELERSEEMWKSKQQEADETAAAFSLMRDGVVMISNDLRIVLINPAARRLLDLDPDQWLANRPFAEVVRIPKLNQALSRVLGEDESQKLLIEVTTETVVLPVDVRIDRILRGVSGSLLMGLRDVTDAQLVESMRREFIANVSHELKTPLAAIKGYAETVEDAMIDDPESAVHFMAQIQDQCLTLETLVADMMELARAQAGRRHFKLGAVSITRTVENSLLAHQMIADQKGVKLVSSAAHPDPLIYSDPDATLTIVNNLISNAVSYTPQGGTVTVSSRQAGRFVALIVEDNGVGIPEMEQERIFERFYRVEKNRETGDGGTGIGLALVKNLVVTMGGEVRVKSISGEGACFEVLLPRFEPDAS